MKGVHSREIDMSAGVPNLPSDNMAEVMRNKFLHDYVELKRKEDEQIRASKD